MKKVFGLSYDYLIDGDTTKIPLDAKLKQIIEVLLSWENEGQAKLKQKGK